MELNELFRPEILTLKPYSCARDEYDGDEAIFLDANENPYDNGCNRYPDPRHRLLRKRLSTMRGVEPKRIILGNGSDELIDMLIRSTCRPGVDDIAVFSPGYAMYEISAAVNGAGVRRIGLTPATLLPCPAALAAATGANTKLAFICSPNNPCGNAVPLATIAAICRSFEGLVVVDEAYVDFTDTPSAVSLSGACSNLFVLQTLSKSWGMAGLRIGIGIGSQEIVAVLDKVKTPYNISGVAQCKALELLNDTEGFAARVKEIGTERGRLEQEFARLGIFTRIFPSEANFLLVSTSACRELYGFLSRNGVVVRLRDIPPLIPDCLRISVGTTAENDRLLELLVQFAASGRPGGYGLPAL